VTIWVYDSPAIVILIRPFAIPPVRYASAVASIRSLWGPAARKRLFLLPEPLQLLLFYGERITLSLWLVCVPIPPGVVLYVRLPVLRLFFF
jgi:hypothetical protein